MLFSCAKEDVFIDDLAEDPSLEIRKAEKVTRKDQNTAKKNLANELSCLVAKNPKVLNVFDKLCIASNEKNDHYEVEFFWNLVKDDPVVEENSLSELLIEQNPSNSVLLDYICQNVPAMTILKLGEEDATEFESKVYYDDDFDDQDPNANVGYFENCVEGTTSILKEPTKISFIVREAENYISKVQLNNPNFSKFKSPIQTIANVCGNDIVVSINAPGTGPDGPSGPVGPRSCDEECERDCVEGTENFYRLKATNDYDSWRGKGEFMCWSIFADDVEYDIDENGNVDIQGGALSYVYHRWVGIKGNDEWFVVNGEIIIWDLETDGNRIKHVLFEDDGGDSEEFSPTLSVEVYGVEIEETITIQLDDGDDSIGESIAEYCQDIDPNGFSYNPSNQVTFRLNER